MNILKVVLVLLLCSCNKNADMPNISDCNKGSTISIETHKEHIGLILDESNYSILDTCYYWDFLGVYVMKIDIYSPNGNKPLGDLHFMNPFSVSVIFGDSILVSGEYDIERSFLDPANIVSNGKVCMFSNGNEALNGKINYSICNGKKVVEFNNIDFTFTTDNVIDTIFSLNGKIICKK